MQSRVIRPLAGLLTLGLLTLGACRSGDDAPAEEAPADSSVAQEEGLALVARLQPVGDGGATGEVTFTPEAGGVRVAARMTGLTPGEHGFHVHENGSCEAADLPDDPDTDPNPAGAAGGHFAGADTTHGGPDAASRHDGDLGNVTAGLDGVAVLDRLDQRLRLSGPNSILGKAVIVHAGADDLTTQPSGASGARVACGVVTVFTPQADTTGAM
jgi:superoxide dismutase, Cu-Zn family